jgi:hypothetical protein
MGEERAALRIDLIVKLRALVRQRIVNLRLGLLTGKLALKPLAPTSFGLKLRRQLVAARHAVPLVLGLVGRDRLGDDLPRESTFESLLALAVSLVPSTAITPEFTNPALAHSRSTEPNDSFSDCWWRRTNQVIA